MKYKYYDFKTGVKKAKTKLAIAFSILGLGVGGTIGALAIFGSAHAADPIIYNNISNPTPVNLPSEGPEAYSFAELGGQVQFAGTARTNPMVTVYMSSWACQSGSWFDGACQTTTNQTFSWPITLNIYGVGSNNTAGSLIKTVTKTFAMPYRPSSTPNQCSGDNSKWYDQTTHACYHGLGFTISFSISGLTLPSKAIITVAYNTSHYGPNPVGDNKTCNTTPAGCYYDALNIGLSTTAPTVGSNPVPDAIYANYYNSGDFCTGSGTTTTGSLQMDSPCWTQYKPAFTISASSSRGAIITNTANNPIPGLSGYDFFFWNGNGVIQDFAPTYYQEVITPSGVNNEVLKGTVANDTGQIVTYSAYSGAPIPNGQTCWDFASGQQSTDWLMTIDPSGNYTLTCHFPA